MMTTRRQFLGAAAALASASVLDADAGAPNWGGPVIDTHLHLRRGLDANAVHMDGCGVSNAVLLAFPQAAESSPVTAAAPWVAMRVEDSILGCVVVAADSAPPAAVVVVVVESVLAAT